MFYLVAPAPHLSLISPMPSVRGPGRREACARSCAVSPRGVPRHGLRLKPTPRWCGCCERSGEIGWECGVWEVVDGGGASVHRVARSNPVPWFRAFARSQAAAQQCARCLPAGVDFPLASPSQYPSRMTTSTISQSGAIAGARCGLALFNRLHTHRRWPNEFASAHRSSGAIVKNVGENEKRRSKNKRNKLLIM